MKKRFRLKNNEGKIFYSGSNTHTYDYYYKELEISTELKDKIKLNFETDSDFEINCSDLKKIKVAVEKSVDTIFKHNDFDPFKEKLRKRFPEQYGSDPITHKGITYYLYTKGREFYIDSLISSYLGHIELIDNLIKSNTPLKYYYFESNSV